MPHFINFWLLRSFGFCEDNIRKPLMSALVDQIRQKMEENGVMHSAILAFIRACRLIASGRSALIPESEISPAKACAHPSIEKRS